MNWNKTLVIAFIAVLFSGCFWKFYDFKGANIPNDIENFSVQFFNNEASLVNPRLSMAFTEKLKTKFQSETRLRLIANDGDYQFAGAIVGYSLESAAINPSSGSAQTQFTMTIRCEFNCPKYPEKNFTKNFTSSKIYDAGTDFSSVEETLSDELSTIIVQQIFSQVALDW